MHPLQHKFVRAFGDATAMASALGDIDAEFCGRSYLSPATLRGDLQFFLIALERQGEAFLEITLSDAMSNLFLWARRNPPFYLIQLTPSLASAPTIKHVWSTRYMSLLSFFSVPQHSTARLAA